MCSFYTNKNNKNVQLLVLNDAAAHKLADLMGASLGTMALTRGTINNLVQADQVSAFKFENAVVQMFQAKNMLQDKSQQQQKNLLFSRKTDKVHVLNTIQFLYDQVDQFRATKMQPILTGTAISTPALRGHCVALERRKIELLKLKELVKVDLEINTVQSIISALTVAVQRGWVFGGMPQIYNMQAREHDLTALATRLAPMVVRQTNVPAPYTAAPAGRGRGYGGGRGRGRGRGRGGRGRGRGRGAGRGVPNNTPATPAPNAIFTRVPQVPNQMYLKKQLPSHVFSIDDPDLGKRINWTSLKAITGYCNNWQIWGRCAVYDTNKAQCPYYKQCSNCNSTTHGRRACPQNLPGENPNA